MKTAPRQPVAENSRTAPCGAHPASAHRPIINNQSSIINRKGTALVMVVVLTVLLAVIGVLFVMVARIDDMATSSVVYDRDLDNAVDTVTEMIAERLAEDVPIPGNFTTYADRAAPNGDRWLAPVQPAAPDPNGTPGDYSDDIVTWPHVSDLTGRALPALLKVAASGSDLLVLDWYAARPTAKWDPTADARDQAPADADGDGIPDSFWIRLRSRDSLTGAAIPAVTTSRGKPVFAAVRIVDNCAMLNLNTASYIHDPNTWPDLEGRYLSSVDYHRFLRGGDRLNPMLIQAARQAGAPLDPPAVYHHNALMHIEKPAAAFDFDNNGTIDYAFRYSLFDIADELEIRNRFMLTSLFEARFERTDVAYETFDFGRGQFAGGWNVDLRSKRIPYDTSTFRHWAARIDPNNFDDRSGAYTDGTIAGSYEWRYDRRHVSTFYSFDRNLNLGRYPAWDALGNPVRSIFEPRLFNLDPVAVSTNFGVWDPVAGVYNYNNTQTRVQILKLLYAARAWFLVKHPNWDYKRAAKQACQFVANMIDYVDRLDPANPTAVQSQGPFFDAAYGSQTNENPTYFDRAVIRELILEVSAYLSKGARTIDIDVDTRYDFGIGIDDDRQTVYGYERQPFFSKVVRYENNVSRSYAIELCNPYTNPQGAIDLTGWRIKVGDDTYIFPNTDAVGNPATIPAATSSMAADLGRLVIVRDSLIAQGSGANEFRWPTLRIDPDDVIELQRPNPADWPDPANPLDSQFITVDRTEPQQAGVVNSASGFRYRVSKRDDTKWRFTNVKLHEESDEDDPPQVGLGSANNTSDLSGDGWQLPVANNNDPIDTLRDFEMVLLVGSERDPNGTVMKPITEHIASAADEGDVRMDVIPNDKVFPLDYFCFMGRPEGSLPGRININTAPMEVIRAAIRDTVDPLDVAKKIDNEALARNIIKCRYFKGLPWGYHRITDLVDPVRVTDFDQFAVDPNGNPDPLDHVGDPEMTNDFEERDWILSQVANLFTVRSDTFTAYILVRLGNDGPQRRMIAIFDRTNVNRDPRTGRPTAKPRLVALHPVPDPR